MKYACEVSTGGSKKEKKKLTDIGLCWFSKDVDFLQKLTGRFSLDSDWFSLSVLDLLILLSINFWYKNKLAGIAVQWQNFSFSNAQLLRRLFVKNRKRKRRTTLLKFTSCKKWFVIDACRSGRQSKKEKGLDRNPAPFKIQYPMKNRDKNKRRIAIMQEATKKRIHKKKKKAKVETLARF